MGWNEQSGLEWAGNWLRWAGMVWDGWDGLE